jgi:hypothetical protein
VRAGHAEHAAGAAHTEISEVAVGFVPAVGVAPLVVPDAAAVLVASAVAAVFDVVDLGMAAAALAEDPSHLQDWPGARRRQHPNQEASRFALVRRLLHLPQTCLRHSVRRCRRLGPCRGPLLGCPYLAFLSGPCAFAL